jgi:HK97 gp10 family phage protein
MSVIVKVEGFKELDYALGDLPKQLAKNVLVRVLKKAGQPIAAAAASYAPKDTGELSDHIIVSAKIKNVTGNAEFSAAMKGGLGVDAARSAMRDARRAAKNGGSFAVMYVGPAQAKTKKNAIKRIVQEFGSSKMPAHPYMRPAWDARKNEALDIIKRELGPEIERTATRLAKKKAKATLL